MSRFRNVYVCQHCGKVYNYNYWMFISTSICGRCGSTKVLREIRKPILFGLKGWKKPDYEKKGKNETKK